MAEIDDLLEKFAEPTAPPAGRGRVTVRPFGERPVEPPVTPDIDTSDLMPMGGGQPAPAAAPAPAGQPFNIDSILQRFDSADNNDAIRAEFPPGYEMLDQWSRGVSQRMANVTGAGLGLVNRAFNLAGMSVLEEGADPVEAVKKAFNIVGLPKDAVPTFMEKFGASSLDSAVMLAAIYASAPAAAARTGLTVKDYLLREFGKFTLKRPGLVAAGEFGSAAGSILGEDVTGSPLGAIPGAVVGGLVATGAAGALGAANTIAKRTAEGAIEHIARLTGFRNAFPGAPKAGAIGPNDPPVRGFGDPADTGAFAKNAFEGGIEEVASGIADAIRRVPDTGSSAHAATRTRELIEQSRRIARRVESEFWKKVNTRERIPNQDLKDFAAQLKGGTTETPSQQPTDFIDRIIGKIEKGKLKVKSEFTGPASSIAKLMDFRGEVRRARWEDMDKAMPNQGLQRNLQKLEEILMDVILAGRPNDPNIKMAREFSKQLNDYFSRGPVADVLAKTARGDRAVHSSETMLELMKHPDGLDQLVGISRWLRDQRLPSRLAFRDARKPTPPEVRVLRDMETQSEQTIRNMYLEAFREAGPGNEPMAAERFMKQHRDSIKSLARVSTELNATTAELTHLAAKRDMINKGALARFTAAAPEVSINRILNDPRPEIAGKKIMTELAGNDQAIEGLRTGIIDNIIARSKSHPSRIQEFINQPRMARMLDEVFDPDMVARLRRITEAGVRLEKGDDTGKNWRQVFRPAVLLSGIIGAQVGRQVARFTGGGTVQTPGIAAGAARRFMEQMFRQHNPDFMLRNAIMSPRWEKLLLSRVPENSRSAMKMTKRMRRMISAVEGGKEAFTDSLDEPEDIEDDNE